MRKLTIAAANCLVVLLVSCQIHAPREIGTAGIPTPVIRDLKRLFREPLPRGPLIVHMTGDEWKVLSERIPISETPIPRDATGILVTPDGFNGYFGAFTCGAGSKEGWACVPNLVRKGVSVTWGHGCSCFFGN